MELQALKTAPEFERLTNQQKLCVYAFVESRDPLYATMAAYDCDSLAKCRRLRYDVFTRRSILECLKAVLGNGDKQLRKLIAHARRLHRI